MTNFTAAQIEEMKTAHAFYVANGMEKEGNILSLAIRMQENPAMRDKVMSALYAEYKKAIAAN